MSEREYFASEWWPNRADGPIDLWRKQGDELESFSREDLGWHRAARDDLSWQLDGRALSSVDPVTAERFVRACRGVHDAPDLEAGPVGSSFVVAETFDLAARAGLLVSGRLQFGVVRQGETLYSATTAEPVPVLAVEFPGDDTSGRLTLLVDRRYASEVQPGRVLRSPR